MTRQQLKKYLRQLAKLLPWTELDRPPTSSDLAPLHAESRHLAAMAMAVFQTGAAIGVAAIAIGLAIDSAPSWLRAVIIFSGVTALFLGIWAAIPLLDPVANQRAAATEQLKERRQAFRTGLVVVMASIVVPATIAGIWVAVTNPSAHEQDVICSSRQGVIARSHVLVCGQGPPFIGAKSPENRPRRH